MFEGVMHPYQLPCSCGRGVMLYLKAGPRAMFKGRYYYICPAQVKHTQWFIWADSLQDEAYSHFHPLIFSSTSNTQEQSQSGSRTPHTVNRRAASLVDEEPAISRNTVTSSMVDTIVNVNGPKSLNEYLKTVNVARAALLCCVVAWLLCFFMFILTLLLLFLFYSRL